jgi:hypothetical protein
VLGGVRGRGCPGLRGRRQRHLFPSNDMAIASCRWVITRLDENTEGPALCCSASTPPRALPVGRRQAIDKGERTTRPPFPPLLLVRALHTPSFVALPKGLGVV